jgi:hypothetical protein
VKVTVPVNGLGKPVTVAVKVIGVPTMALRRSGDEELSVTLLFEALPRAKKVPPLSV